MKYVCGYLFLRFKDGCEIHQINRSQTLVNFLYSPACYPIFHQMIARIYWQSGTAYVKYFTQKQ